MTPKTRVAGPEIASQASHEASRFLFNPAAEEIPEALSIRFNQMVYELQRQGRDVTVLSLGEAFFDIPLFDFNALNYQKGYHYSDSQGLPELRRMIASVLRALRRDRRRERGPHLGGVQAAHLHVHAGGSTARGGGRPA